MRRVFTYGTLKRGQPNHALLADTKAGCLAKLVGVARTVDTWPLVVAGRYNTPYVLDAKGTGQRVLGEVYAVNTAMLRELDRLEAHPDYYTRGPVRVEYEAPGDEGSTRGGGGAPSPGEEGSTRGGGGAPSPGEEGSTRRGGGAPSPGEEGSTRRGGGAPSPGQETPTRGGGGAPNPGEETSTRGGGGAPSPGDQEPTARDVRAPGQQCPGPQDPEPPGPKKQKLCATQGEGGPRNISSAPESSSAASQDPASVQQEPGPSDSGVSVPAGGLVETVEMYVLKGFRPELLEREQLSEYTGAAGPAAYVTHRQRPKLAQPSEMWWDVKLKP